MNLLSIAAIQKTIQESQRLAKGISDKDLNINLVTQHLTPLIEKIVEVIERHADAKTLAAVIDEFRELFGEDAA